MAERGHAPVDIALKTMLEQVEVEARESTPMLVCTRCAADVCEIEAGDTMRVLVNMTIDHVMNDCD